MATIRGNNRKNTLSGTGQADTILGLGGNDKLLGKSGNDVLKGGSGNDLLDGGKGKDTMKGGKGDDIYVVDRTSDKVVESAGQGTDTVKSSVTFTIGPNVELLVLTGSKAINGTLNSAPTDVGHSITGNKGANVLIGGAGHDVLSGRLGADVLDGRDGNDTLVPGSGDGVADIIVGGLGFDTVDYRDALGGVTVKLGTGEIGGSAAGDVVVGVESVVGSAFADTLMASDAAFSNAFGGGGADFIVGNPDAFYDRMRGDDGLDFLTGAAGEEDFVLQYDRGKDTVFNYRNTGDDHVLLDHTEFGLTLTGPTRSLVDNVEFFSANIGGQPVFLLPTLRLIFDTSTRILWADKDGSGTAFNPVQIAEFHVLTSFAPTAGDIWLV